MWAAHAFLAAGLFGPCFTVTPRMGPYTGLARWFGLLEQPETYSILRGIQRMLTGGNVAIGLLLLVFSVLFPVAKLIALRGAMHDLRAGRRPTRLAHLATRLGKFSMVDVFVLALFVIAAKSFPGGSTVEIRWGAWAFAAAAFLPIPVGLAITRPPEPDPDRAPA